MYEINASSSYDVICQLSQLEKNKIMHKTRDRDSERTNREIEIETHLKRQILNRAIESKR